MKNCMRPHMLFVKTRPVPLLHKHFAFISPDHWEIAALRRLSMWFQRKQSPSNLRNKIYFFRNVSSWYFYTASIFLLGISLLLFLHFLERRCFWWCVGWKVRKETDDENKEKESHSWVKRKICGTPEESLDTERI